MKHLLDMYRAIEFMEEHLKEPIRVNDVADAVSYSLYHFTRTFNSMTGHSPYDYLMRRRLSESVKELVQSNRKVIDIAFDYQFNNPETFSRAYRKMFGILPNQMKKGLERSDLILRSALTYPYLEHINQGDYLHPQWVELPTLYLVGLVCPRDDDTALTEAREEIHQEISALTGYELSKHYYSICVHAPHWSSRGYRFLGIKVDTVDQIPPLLLGKVLPAQRYVKFVHKGCMRDVGLTLEYIYQTWLPRSGSVASPIVLESFDSTILSRNDVNADSQRDLLVPLL